jgi:hypothetical protein
MKKTIMPIIKLGGICWGGGEQEGGGGLVWVEIK